MTGGDAARHRRLLEECRCEGGQPKNFLRPALLLLLKERSSHGYDLIERLHGLGFTKSDPGGVYRTLRALERDGHVSSSWETSRAGPARRRYRLTADGEEVLGAWALVLEENRRVLEEYQARYALASASAERRERRSKQHA